MGASRPRSLRWVASGRFHSGRRREYAEATGGCGVLDGGFGCPALAGTRLPLGRLRVHLLVDRDYLSVTAWGAGRSLGAMLVPNAGHLSQPSPVSWASVRQL